MRMFPVGQKRAFRWFLNRHAVDQLGILRIIATQKYADNSRTVARQPRDAACPDLTATSCTPSCPSSRSRATGFPARRRCQRIRRRSSPCTKILIRRTWRMQKWVEVLFRRRNDKGSSPCFRLVMPLVLLAGRISKIRLNPAHCLLSWK